MNLFTRALAPTFFVVSSVVADPCSFLGLHRKKIGLVSALVGHYILTKASSSYQQRSTNFLDQAKEALVLKVIAPILTKVEHVKHDGLSHQDVIIAACLPVLGAHLQLHRFDQARTREVLSHDLTMLNKHKLLVAGSLLVAAAILFAYLEGLKLPFIQQFMCSLSRRQKHAIDRCPHMQQLLENRHEDPKALLDHDPLVGLLHDHQIELLDKAVQEHLLHNDPLSLLDGID